MKKTLLSIIMLMTLATAKNQATFTSISLESNVTTLNVGEKADLTLVGTYSSSLPSSPMVTHILT